MTEDIRPRKAALEERIRVAEYCIANSNDYPAAAKAYSCSYGQVYFWAKKYEADGVDGLKDGRGRTRPEEEPGEMKKLKAENRLPGAACYNGRTMETAGMTISTDLLLERQKKLMLNILTWGIDGSVMPLHTATVSMPMTKEYPGYAGRKKYSPI